jgi:hypothetical protein
MPLIFYMPDCGMSYRLVVRSQILMRTAENGYAMSDISLSPVARTYRGRLAASPLGQELVANRTLLRTEPWRLGREPWARSTDRTPGNRIAETRPSRLGLLPILWPNFWNSFVDLTPWTPRRYRPQVLGQRSRRDQTNRWPDGLRILPSVVDRRSHSRIAGMHPVLPPWRMKTFRRQNSESPKRWPLCSWRTIAASMNIPVWCASADPAPEGP